MIEPKNQNLGNTLPKENLEVEKIGEDLGEDFSVERSGAKNPLVEKTKTVEDIPVVENLEVEKPAEQIEISESKVVENVAEEKIEDEQVEITEEKVNDNLGSIVEQKKEEISQIKTEVVKSVEQVPEQKVEQKQPIQNQETPAKVEIKTVEKIIYKTDPNLIQNLLNKARAKIQERKRKKLDKIMVFFETKSQIRSRDVRKSLFVKKRTATNYLNQLEKEQRIIQIGKKGNEVFYIKKP